MRNIKRFVYGWRDSDAATWLTRQKHNALIVLPHKNSNSCNHIY